MTTRKVPRQSTAWPTEDASGYLRFSFQRMRDVARQRPRAWDLAEAAFAAGWQGVRVPSVQAPCANLVLWRWNSQGGAVVKHLDPLGDLPRNHGSWLS